jgi:radical SAM superfamily enzyme YgiQ (UPF0313 family)
MVIHICELFNPHKDAAYPAHKGQGFRRMFSMKIFLIDVRDDHFCHILPAKRGNKQNGRVSIMAFPPLGIQTLAPILRQQGHDVRLFDTCHPAMKAEDIAEIARKDTPGVIGLSSLSITAYKYVKNTAALLKAAAPKTPIIAGGPFATMNAVYILRDCSAIDSVGRGEGEDLLPEFVNCLHNLAAVDGLTWRKGSEIVENRARPAIHDLDQYPYPDRTSLPIDYIESLPLEMPAVLSLDKFCTMQTSRGCPFRCIYCDIPALNGGKWRSHSPPYVLGEMQQLHDQGYRSIYLTDDHFLMKEKRIKEICEGIIEKKFAFHWGCEGRVDSVGVSQLPLMVKANCRALAFGIESGTQKNLDRLKKHQTLEQVQYAIGQAKKHGVENIHGFFVIGCPDETEFDILESFRFAATLGLDSFGFNRLCVYRGTPLWKEYVERGLIDDARDWSQLFRCAEVDPTALPSEVVHRIRKKGFKMLFTHMILRHPLKTFTLLRKFGRHMSMADLIKLLATPFRKLNCPNRLQLQDGSSQ